MQRYEHMGNYVEMWKRVAEVSAINEHTETIVNIPEYIVVVSMHGQYENLHYANDYDDAHRLFDLESKYLTPIPNATTHAH